MLATLLLTLAWAGAPFMHSPDVVAAALSPDGSFLVTFHEGTTARKWSFPQGAPLAEITLPCLPEWLPPAISPDGSRLALLCGSAPDATMRIVPTKAGAGPAVRVNLPSISAKAMRGLLWSADGHTVGVLREKRFDLFSSDGKPIHHVEEPNTQVRLTFAQHQGKWALAGFLLHLPDEVRTKRFDSPDAPYRSSDEEGVRVMDATGTPSWTRRDDAGPVAFSLDGKQLLMASSGSLTVMDIGTEERRSVSLGVGTLLGVWPRVGGTWVHSGDVGLVRVNADLQAVGAPVRTDGVLSASPDGKFLVVVTAEGDDRLFVWDAAGAPVTATQVK